MAGDVVPNKSDNQAVRWKRAEMMAKIETQSHNFENQGQWVLFLEGLRDDIAKLLVAIKDEADDGEGIAES